MANAVLRAKPNYTVHRRVTGAPIAPDSADLSLLINYSAIPVGGGAAVDHRRRDLIDCAGWKTVRVFVKAAGGAGAAVTLIPIELVKYEDTAGDAQEELSVIGSATSSLADGVSEEVTVNGCILLLRISAIANAPTSADIYVAGETRMEHEPGQGRV